MILSGKEIARQVNIGTIQIDPFSPTQVNPNSYNLRLHNELLTYPRTICGGRGTRVWDMKEPMATEVLSIPEEGRVLFPGNLYLGRTVERTATDAFVPMLEGRSSIGRLGLSVHVTAGFGDIGFDGFWTLELWCVHPIRIYPNIEICQIYYHTIMGDYDLYHSGKYQKNTGIQGSKLYEDFRNNP